MSETKHESVSRVLRRWTVNPSRGQLALLVTISVSGCLLYLFVRHGSYAALSSALGVGKIPLHDFEAFFYPMGRKVYEDPTPVDGFLYSPFAAMLFGLLGFLPYKVAAIAWASILLASTLWIALAAGKLLCLRDVGLRLFSVVLTVLCYPALHNLKFGQVSTLLFAGALLAYAAALRDKSRTAAFLLSIVIAVKYYAFILALPFVYRRDLRVMGYLIGFLLIWLVLLPALLLGPSDTLTFYANVAGQLDTRFAGNIQDRNSQSLASFLHRLGVSDGIRILIQIVASVALAGWSLILARTRRRDDMLDAFVVALCATPFVVPTSWPHYFVYLPFCQIAVWSRLRGGRQNRVWWLAVVLTSLSTLSSSMILFDAVANRHLFVRAFVLLAGNLALLGGLACARQTGSVLREYGASTCGK
jgi:hypothetical protein